MPQVEGDLRLEYYRATDAKVDPDLRLRLNTGIYSESMQMSELSDNAMVLRAGYRWSPVDMKGIEAAMGIESIQGGAQSGDYHSSFQLRWSY